MMAETFSRRLPFCCDTSLPILHRTRKRRMWSKSCLKDSMLRVALRRGFWTIYFLFMLYFACQACYKAIIMILYLRSLIKSQYNEEECLRLYQNLVRDQANFRNLGSTGLMYYAIYFALITNFFLIHFIPTRDQFTQFCESILQRDFHGFKLIWDKIYENGQNETELSWSARDDEYKFITKQAKIFIRLSLHSNYNLSIMLNRSSIKRKSIIKHDVGCNRKQTVANSYNFIPKLDKDLFNSDSDFTEEPSLDRSNLQLDYLRSQREHLMRRAANISPLIPENISNESHRHLSRKAKVVALCTTGYMYAWHTLATLVIHNMAWRSLEHEGRQNDRFGLYGRLNLVEEICLIPWINGWLMACLVPMVVGFRSKFIHFRWLNQKLDGFFREVELLRKLEQFSTHARQLDSGFDLSATIGIKRADCDSAAMDIYLSFMSLTYGLRPSLERACNIFARSVNVMLCLFVVVLSTIRPDELQGAQLIFNLTVLMGGMCCLNLVFLVAAAFNTSCLRLAKRSWSLMAEAACSASGLPSMQQIERDFRLRTGQQTCYSKHNSDDTYRLYMPANCTRYDRKFELRSDTAPPEVTNRRSIRERHSFSNVVTLHTLILWQRIMADHESLKDRTTCRVYGKFRLDYASILRFNFWIFSIAILLINTR